MTYLIIILFLLFLLLLLISVGYYRKKPTHIPINYIKGLEYLSDGEYEKATYYLNRAWKEDPENIDAYLRVGDILRETGNVKSAIMIHRNLSVKPLMPKDKKVRVLHSLAEDYIASKNYDDAIKTLIKIIHEGDDTKETQKKLLGLFELKGDWENAFETARNFYQDRKSLYGYGVYAGLKLLGKDRETAYRFIKQGLKAKLPLAKLANALYLIENGEHTSGIEQLKKTLEEHPQYSEAGLDTLEKIMFEKGRFSEIEGVYRGIIEKDPQNIPAISHYVDFLLKKGDKNKALDLISSSNLPEDHPDTLNLKLKVYIETDIERIKEIAPILLRSCKRLPRFRCRECGYETENFDWKCPECFGIDTLYRV